MGDHVYVQENSKIIKPLCNTSKGAAWLTTVTSPSHSWKKLKHSAKKPTPVSHSTSTAYWRRRTQKKVWIKNESTVSDHLSLIIPDKLYTTERENTTKLWTGNTSTHTSQSGSSRMQNVSKFWRMRIRNTEKTVQNQNWVAFNKVLFTRIGYLKHPWNRNGERHCGIRAS